jgi:uncharacterized membrane protein YkoI
MLRQLFALVLALSWLGFDAAAVAADHDRARGAVQSGQVRPLGEVLSNVRRNYSGRMLDARLVQGGGRPVYVIKLLTPTGRVLEVTADAPTGRVLGAR